MLTTMCTNAWASQSCTLRRDLTVTADATSEPKMDLKHFDWGWTVCRVTNLVGAFTVMISFLNAVVDPCGQGVSELFTVHVKGCSHGQSRSDSRARLPGTPAER